MKFNLTCSVGALFKFHVYKADSGELVRESEWSPNIVLDVGLNHINGIGGDFPMGGLAVGTGSSEPVASQISLDAITAYTENVISKTGGRNVTTAPYYLFGRRVFRFAQGAAKGNLTEVGICQLRSTNPNVYTFFNRALIKDTLGQPTTITVLDDEFLEVTVEVRNYFPSEITGTFRLLDKLGAVVSTHTYTGKPCLSRNPLDYILRRSAFDFNKFNSYVDDRPMPAGIVTKPQIRDYFTGVAQWQNNRIEGYCQFGLDRGNGFDHRTFFVPITFLFDDQFDNGWQWSIDPPIRKNNTQLLTHRWALQYVRFEGVVE